MKYRILLASLALATPLLHAASPETRDAGRKLSASHHESVVWLSVLAKTSMDAEGNVPAEVRAALAGQSTEAKSEITGTVIDASGLIVTALKGMDKGSLLDGQTIQSGMGPIKLKASSEIKEIKVITSDGSEIPADLVLKDEDLGIAFIKVRSESDEAKGVTFHAIDLADSASGEPLDDCITLGRLDESLNRTSCILAGEIIAKAEKPRVIYRIDDDSVGCPIFLANGKLLGISVIPRTKNLADASGQMQITPVVLPAADIAKVAAQAKEAPAPAAEAPTE
ncbi:MAG: serine protease [Akkermansiaceae bacterium]|jgi:hypothetical protein|nr:serine protease [Akkermansiaceae bacterium]